MKPDPSYILSSFLFSVALSLFIGYPSAAIFKGANYAPHFGLWFLMTLSLSSILTIYSALKKSRTLLCFNWLVITLVCLAFFGACWLYNPRAVANNTATVIVICVFTFGGPFWVVVLSFFYHCKECSSVASKNA